MIMLCLLALLGCKAEPPEWAEVKRDIRNRWPGIRHLQTFELADRLQSGERILLIDVRAPAEYEVSRIPGARNLPPGSSLPEALGDLQAHDTLVFYCAMGYRSSRAVAELGQLTGKSIFNLEGSIFQWANEGRPLENAQGTVARVHPFDETWGRLLDENRARLPR
jgi:rhodanese-related sulfurtransferase